MYITHAAFYPQVFFRVIAQANIMWAGVSCAFNHPRVCLAMLSHLGMLSHDDGNTNTSQR